MVWSPAVPTVIDVHAFGLTLPSVIYTVKGDRFRRGAAASAPVSSNKSYAAFFLAFVCGQPDHLHPSSVALRDFPISKHRLAYETSATMETQQVWRFATGPFSRGTALRTHADVVECAAARRRRPASDQSPAGVFSITPFVTPATAAASLAGGRNTRYQCLVLSYALSVPAIPGYGQIDRQSKAVTRVQAFSRFSPDGSQQVEEADLS